MLFCYIILLLFFWSLHILESSTYILDYSMLLLFIILIYSSYLFYSILFIIKQVNIFWDTPAKGGKQPIFGAYIIWSLQPWTLLV